MTRPPQTILISGYFGFGNLGDEAILEATVAELRRRDPGREFFVVSGNPRETAVRFGVGAVPFGDVDQIADATAHSSLVLFGLGGVFQDYWGAAASSFFHSETNGVEAYARPAVLARLNGVPSVLFGAGVGPLSTEAGRRIFSLAADLAEILVVRDEASAEAVQIAGSAKPPVVAADPAFLLSASKEDRDAITEKLEVRGFSETPFVAFALRSWSFGANDSELARAAGEAAASLPEGWKALFLPLHRGAGTDDREIARAAVEASSKRGEVFEIESPGQAIALLEKARIAVGMRLHSVVFAAAAGTPAVPIVYDPKVEAAGRSLLLEELLVPVSKPELLAERLQRAIAAEAQLRGRLAERLPEVRASAMTAFDLVERILENAAAPSAAAAAPKPKSDPVRERLLQSMRRLRMELDQTAREAATARVELSGELQATKAKLAELEGLLLSERAERERQVASERAERERHAERERRVAAERAERASESEAAERERRRLEEELSRLREDGRIEKTYLEAQLSGARQELTRIQTSRFWKAASIYWAVLRRLRRLAGSLRGKGLEAPGAGPTQGTVVDRSAAATPAAATRVPAEPETAPVVAVAPVPPPTVTGNLHEVVCFPIIDWDFRFQRPQQLMSQFAAAGHRVFYLSQRFRESGPPWEIAEKRRNVFEVSLRGPSLNVYTGSLDEGACEALFGSLDALRRDLALGAAISFVQLPFWWPLARIARERLAWPVLYDCMDHHAGFSTNRPAMLEQEEELLSEADLVIATSRYLEETVRGRARSLLRVPNACDYEHFAALPERAPGPRPAVGYYGAIADWFDSDLVADLAQRRPDWDFLLVGSTFTADLRRLSELPNVTLPGEQPYSEIPGWLSRLDVALIPFKRIPLTEATNPVKAYEILAGGKPLVSVPLPEVVPLAPLVRLASTPAEFEREIEAALAEQNAEAVAARRAFARQNTWESRFLTLAPAVARSSPKVSIVVVTYNNLELNRLCLESVFTRTEWPNFEVFVVDNGSTDGTPEYLRELEGTRPGLRVILNEKNRGFAAANNQGLREATGDCLVLLNNDTVVPRGWLAPLVRHLARDRSIGLVGPVTNEVGNEAKVEIGYRTLEEMPGWAEAWMREHDGETFPIPMLAMFCVAMRRETLERVGLLDERFGIGMFEDDDYTRRLRQQGYRIVCARDAFVHHAGRASFKLLGEEKYLEIFERNRRLYQRKWGEMWEPHVDGTARQRVPALRDRLREIVAASGVPPERVVVFLSSIGWATPLVQRPHHLAAGFARRGWLVFFDCTGSQIDHFADFAPVERNLWLYRGARGVLEELEGPVLWAFPYNVPLLDRFRGGTIVYDYIDDLSVFPYKQKTLAENHARMLEEADLVFCVAKGLLRQVEPKRPDALYLPNGAEAERFAEPAGAAELAPEFLELASNGRPIAGYYGAIASWFDAELLAAAAALRSDWGFAVIGKTLSRTRALRALKKLSNVRVLGAQPYAALPHYLARFTAAMIPFRINRITEATSPIKLYEYFAGGKPVIATAMPECAAFPEVHIVRSAKELSTALDRAQEEEKDPAFRERMRAIGRRNSWSARVEAVEASLEACRERSGARPATRAALSPSVSLSESRG